MSVLLVELCSGPRTAWEQTFLLARELQRPEVWPGARPEVWLACPKDSELASMANGRDIPLIELSSLSGAALWWVLGRIVRERGISVLHTLDRRALFPAALLRRRRAAHVVHTVQYIPDRKQRLPGWPVSQADALVFSGVGLKDVAACRDPGKARVILPAAREAVLPRRRGKDGRFIFFAADALTPSAEMDVLLEAMALLQEADAVLPPWEVRVAGAGPSFQSLLEKAAQGGVQTRLALLGEQDSLLLLADADAVVIPRVETSGDVSLVLDAWRFGVPVVCTNAPSYAEIAEPEVSALMAPPREPRLLADAMLRLMQEEPIRARLRAGGREALQRFSPVRMAGEYAALYEQWRQAPLSQ